MEQVVARDNMWAALKRVEGNKGVGGSDGVDVSQLRDLLRESWSQVRTQLLPGTCRPVCMVEIPKPGGGIRALGMPTCWAA